MGEEKIHWGIIGLGKIAHTFAEDIARVDSCRLHAVASRSLDKARTFKDKFQATNAHGSYEALAIDDTVDIVYIATPHPFHYEHTMLCLRHGKHVLCEKPMGMSREQVEAVIAFAKAKNLFLMEGIWTRFMPTIEKLLELLRAKAIGELRFIKADFGFAAPKNLQGRIFNKELGGGSLLDIGIYPIYLSLLLLGMPSDIKAMARLTETHVDGYCGMLFDYKNDQKANLESTIQATTPCEAYIYGEHGHIKIHGRFHESEKLTLQTDDHAENFDLPLAGNGYVHEINEVVDCLRAEKCQSDKLPWSTSLQVAEILDRVRAEIGLKYD